MPPTCGAETEKGGVTIQIREPTSEHKKASPQKSQPGLAGGRWAGEQKIGKEKCHLGGDRTSVFKPPRSWPERE